MPVNVNDFIDILAEICKEKNLRCAVTSSLKGAAVAGTCTGIGGLLLGPVGLVMGGVLGGIVAASTSPEYKGVPEILWKMSQKQKQELCSKIVYAFRDFGLPDIAAIAAVVMSQNAMRNLAIEEVQKYLTKDMGLQLCR